MKFGFFPSVKSPLKTITDNLTYPYEYIYNRCNYHINPFYYLTKAIIMMMPINIPIYNRIVTSLFVFYSFKSCLICAIALGYLVSNFFCHRSHKTGSICCLSGRLIFILHISFSSSDLFLSIFSHFETFS